MGVRVRVTRVPVEVPVEVPAALARPRCPISSWFLNLESSPGPNTDTQSGMQLGYSWDIIGVGSTVIVRIRIRIRIRIRGGKFMPNRSVTSAGAPSYKQHTSTETPTRISICHGIDPMLMR